LFLLLPNDARKGGVSVRKSSPGIAARSECLRCAEIEATEVNF